MGFNWRQSNTKHIYNRNMKLLLTLVALFAGSQAAPQYGPVGGQQGDGTAPLQQRAPAAPARTKCRTEYTTIWDTEYVETENQVCTTVYVNECNTLYKKQCQNVPREVCTTVNDRQCSTVYRDVCTKKFRTEYEDYTETECTTEHKEDCEYHWEGQGEAKVWVPIPGTCKSNPYNTCVDVKRSRERDRFPILTVAKFQRRSVSMFPRRSAQPYRRRSAGVNRTKSAIKSPRRSATMFTRRFRTESANEFPRRFVTMVLELAMAVRRRSLARVPLLSGLDQMRYSLLRSWQLKKILKTLPLSVIFMYSLHQ